MLIKLVDTRATTAARAGSAPRGLGRNTPFLRRGSILVAENDPRPSKLQLKIDGLTARKIGIIEQLAYKNKALVIVLQEINCTTTDKLAILNFSLAWSVLSRKHDFATFVHKKSEWTLIDQPTEQGRSANKKRCGNALKNSLFKISTNSF